MRQGEPTRHLDAIQCGNEQGRGEPAGVAEQGRPGTVRGQIREAGGRAGHVTEPHGAPQLAFDPTKSQGQRGDAGGLPNDLPYKQADRPKRQITAAKLDRDLTDATADLRAV